MRRQPIKWLKLRLRFANRIFVIMVILGVVLIVGALCMRAGLD